MQMLLKIKMMMKPQVKTSLELKVTSLKPVHLINLGGMIGTEKEIESVT